MRRSHSALRHSPHTQTGFSLVEMMIAITLGLLVLGGATSVFSSTLGTNSAIAKNTRLNQDVRAAMEYISRDLRRSGYFSGDPVATVNPFQNELSTQEGGKCVLYAYDTLKDAALGNEDKLGIRLSNNALQVRRSAALCNAGTSWENITDPATVKVKTLNVSMAPIFCTNVTTDLHTDCLQKNPDNSNNPNYVAPKNGDIMVNTYNLTITIEAELVSDSAVSTTATNVVRLKNDSITVK